jgi:hypothetical protein
VAVPCLHVVPFSRNICSIILRGANVSLECTLFPSSKGLSLLFGKGAREEPTPCPALNQHLGVVWTHEAGPTIGHVTHIALAR